MSTCPICKNSGETGSYGVLDCSAPNCTAAVERLALEAAASTASLTDYDARWMAYGLGKAAALEKAAKVADNMLEVTWSGESSSTAESIAAQIRALKP